MQGLSPRHRSPTLWGFRLIKSCQCALVEGAHRSLYDQLDVVAVVRCLPPVRITCTQTDVLQTCVHFFQAQVLPRIAEHLRTELNDIRRRDKPQTRPLGLHLESLRLHPQNFVGHRFDEFRRVAYLACCVPRKCFDPVIVHENKRYLCFHSNIRLNCTGILFRCDLPNVHTIRNSAFRRVHARSIRCRVGAVYSVAHVPTPNKVLHSMYVGRFIGYV